MAIAEELNKAVVYAAPGTTETKIEKVEIPKPGTGQIGGHEGVGSVIAHGEGVTEPKIGSRVGIKWLADVCNTCPSCLENDDNTCDNKKVSGYYTPGTFQKYVVTSASYATPIPDGIESAAAAPFLCAGLTVYSGLLKAQARPGDWVVISGAGGGLGHLAVQYTSHVMGLRVIAIDHGSKEQICKDCGAHEFLDFTAFNDETLPKRVKEIANNGRGANVVVIVNAANKSYEQGLGFLKPQGTLVCIGIPEGTPVAIQSAYPAWITTQQFRIIGSAIGNRREAIEALDFAARGLVKCHYKLEQMDNLSQVFDDMAAGKIEGRVVLEIK
ncbi:alcohol dehydrogenase [Lachnellula occidentalis]|uniref:Alcohol dehydrogenase n=1 Tax=Lachnellula occidentalis TaxID=215460 RepID=A0A8H8S494_9HELO|nr:alcohol dehydrogenase [Lachnellula occidentalis]